MRSRDTCRTMNGELAAYVIGDISADQYRILQKHMAECSACRQEAARLREAWGLIPVQLEEAEPPEGMKEEVLAAALANGPGDRAEAAGEEGQAVRRQEKRKRDNRVSRPALSRWIAAAAVTLLVAALWNNVQLRNELQAKEQQLRQPAQLVDTYALNAAEAASSSSTGTAWLYEQGGTKRLVFQLQGLAPTQGEQAYQVWLLYEGNRRSAGVFRVDASGIGVLTYQMSERQLPFDAIGITLEPDSQSASPRGRKVLGT